MKRPKKEDRRTLKLDKETVRRLDEVDNEILAWIRGATCQAMWRPDCYGRISFPPGG